MSEVLESKNKLLGFLDIATYLTFIFALSWIGCYIYVLGFNFFLKTQIVLPPPDFDISFIFNIINLDILNNGYIRIPMIAMILGVIIKISFGDMDGSLEGLVSKFVSIMICVFWCLYNIYRDEFMKIITILVIVITIIAIIQFILNKISKKVGTNQEDIDNYAQKTYASLVPAPFESVIQNWHKVVIFLYLFVLLFYSLGVCDCDHFKMIKFTNKDNSCAGYMYGSTKNVCFEIKNVDNKFVLNTKKYNLVEIDKDYTLETIEVEKQGDKFIITKKE